MSLLENITGAQSLQQTGRSPITQAVKPVLGEAAILATVEVGKELPPRVVILTALAVEFLAVAQHLTSGREIEHPECMNMVDLPLVRQFGMWRSWKPDKAIGGLRLKPSGRLPTSNQTW